MATLTAVVIDDEKDIAEIISGIIEIHNIKVVGLGYNGNHAVRLVNEKKPDIVFLDVKMSEKDGIEALQEIKAIAPSTKVIMVTGEETEEMKKKIQDNNADGMIFKPFEMEKFLKVLTKAKLSINTSTKKP